MQATGQGLKLQGMSAPAPGANLTSTPPVGQSSGTSGKSGLRATPPSTTSDLKTQEVPSPVVVDGNAEKEYSDFIVAIVDSEPITNREVNQRAQDHLDQMKQQGAPLPPKEALLSNTL